MANSKANNHCSMVAEIGLCCVLYCIKNYFEDIIDFFKSITDLCSLSSNFFNSIMKQQIFSRLPCNSRLDRLLKTSLNKIAGTEI